MNELSLIDQASRELPTAMAALEAGDPEITRYTRGVRQLLEGVTRQSRETLTRAETLRGDDQMNPVGRGRLLSELPGTLMAATTDPLAQAELNLDLIESFHLAAILRHDHRDDANLR